MKRLFLLGLVFTAGIGMVDAQTHRALPKNLGPKVQRATKAGQDVRVKRTATPGAAKSGAGNSVQASYGTQIGHTYYDLQSNASSGNRLKRDANGGLHATWIEACTPDPGATAYPDRGAGYNYMPAGGTWSEGTDGTCELPDAVGGAHGVSVGKVGWPEMLVNDATQSEMIIAHTPLKEMHRSGGYGSPAANPFTTTAPVASATGQGIQWPRAVNVGSTVHAIATVTGTVNGVEGGLSYYRSTDFGQTFTEVMLPGHDSATFASGFGGDGYALHANGNTVAITAGDGGDPWVMWKSTDAGLTFTRTIMRPAVDASSVIITTAGDTLIETNDQYQAVVVDNNGNVHAFAGYLLGTVDNNFEYSGYFPLSSEGIWYWNDVNITTPGRTPSLIVDSREDVPGVSWIGNGSYQTPAAQAPYFNGELSMPNAAVATNNDIYLVYSGLVEGTSNTGDSTGQSFRDLYAVKIIPGSMSVSTPKNIANEIANVGRTDFEEDVFASVAHEMGADNMLHMIWQSDSEPGLYVRGDEDPETDNEIMHYGFDVTAQTWNMGSFVFGFVGLSEDMAQHFNSISAMPNPTTGVAQLNLDLKKGANVAVKVTNLLGQEVMSVKSSFMNAGANTMKLDLSKQADGVYLYTVTTDGFSVTNRIVKQ